MINLKRYILAAAVLGTLLLLTPGTYSQAGRAYRLQKGALLVARPQLASELFRKSVILIVRHNRNMGTLGLIINKPTEHPPADFLKELDEVENLYKDVFIGGPVNKQIPTLLLNTANPPGGADNIFGSVYFSGDPKGVLGGGNRQGDYEIRAYSGISSWARGQLEAEIMRGDWLIVEADSKMVFSKEPEKVWEKLLKKGERESSSLIEVNNRLKKGLGRLS